MNPKTEGVLAFHARKPADVVPYSDKGRRAAWVTGWHDAARAAARRGCDLASEAGARGAGREGAEAGKPGPAPAVRDRLHGVGC